MMATFNFAAEADRIQKENETQKAKIAEQAATIENLSSTIRKQSKEFQQLKIEIRMQARQEEGQKEVIEELLEEINNLKLDQEEQVLGRKGTCGEEQHKVVRLRETIAERDAQVAALKDEVSRLLKKIGKLEGEEERVQDVVRNAHRNSISERGLLHSQRAGMEVTRNPYALQQNRLADESNLKSPLGSNFKSCRTPIQPSRISTNSITAQRNLASFDSLKEDTTVRRDRSEYPHLSTGAQATYEDISVSDNSRRGKKNFKEAWEFADDIGEDQFCAYCDKKGHTEGKCPEWAQQVAETGTQPVRRHPCQNCWKSYEHGLRGCPEPRRTLEEREQLRVILGIPSTKPWDKKVESRRSQATRCWNCWEPGHTRSDCLMPGPKLNLSQSEKLRQKKGAPADRFWIERLQGCGVKFLGNIEPSDGHYSSVGTSISKGETASSSRPAATPVKHDGDLSTLEHQPSVSGGGKNVSPRTGTTGTAASEENRATTTRDSNASWPSDAKAPGELDDGCQEDDATVKVMKADLQSSQGGGWKSGSLMESRNFDEFLSESNNKFDTFINESLNKDTPTWSPRADKTQGGELKDTGDQNLKSEEQSKILKKGDTGSASRELGIADTLLDLPSNLDEKDHIPHARSAAENGNSKIKAEDDTSSVESLTFVFKGSRREAVAEKSELVGAEDVTPNGTIKLETSKNEAWAQGYASSAPTTAKRNGAVGVSSNNPSRESNKMIESKEKKTTSGLDSIKPPGTAQSKGDVFIKNESADPSSSPNYAKQKHTDGAKVSAQSETDKRERRAIKPESNTGHSENSSVSASIQAIQNAKDFSVFLAAYENITALRNRR